MKLSSSYIYEKLNAKYSITDKGNISAVDGYLRPFLYYADKLSTITKEQLKTGHVCIAAEEIPKSVMDFLSNETDIFWIFCLGENEFADFLSPEFLETHTYLCLKASDNKMISELTNELQQLFDNCDEWESQIHELMVANSDMNKILSVTSEFLENPMLVMGLDFSLDAEAGREYLPEKARLYNDDGLNMDYMNALINDSNYQNMANAHEVVLFPAYINGCRSFNKNLFIDGKPAHRLVLIESRSELSDGDVCILNELSEKLEFLLSHQVEATDPDYDMEQLFLRILSDRTADYMQVSRQLSGFGWNQDHKYMCLILQITYVNHQTLSTRAICRYIKKKFKDSVSFLFKDEIVIFFNLSRLKMSQDAVSSEMIYFIRDSYLKAGYSRTMEGHMNLRRQYVQASTALDVGSRSKPYIWVHYFDQVALTYILEQSTRRLPGNMICHEGLLRLKEYDDQNHSDYMKTLEVYLAQHLSATLTARELFIHRSTFLYRLDKIKEILQSNIEDPEEIFYLELSFRILKQEAQKTN